MLPALPRVPLPAPCAVCRAWHAAPLCDACLGRYAAQRLRCRRCALPLEGSATLCGGCLRDPPDFDRALAAVDYGYPWDRLVTDLKFHQALHLAPAMAGLIAQAARAAELARPHWILPVPLSTQRLRERGYNQAWELGRRVARELRCRADARILLRLRDTPQQLTLPRARRRTNVRDAFLVEPRRAAELRDAVVVLIDDVVTTGATAAEAARCLKRAGAAEVQCWMFARTPADGSDA